MRIVAITDEGFAKAYETGRNRTISFLVSRGFPEHLAEETAQDAWVRGWERKAQLRDIERAIPWVNTIALNIGRNGFRRQSRFQELDEKIAASGADLNARVTAAVDVRRKLQQCPARERALLERRYFAECEIGELAQEARCTHRALRIQLFRARQRLRSLFVGAGEAGGNKT